MFLAENPGFTGTPFYKVNKTALARVLPWSLSTVKREFDELIENGLICVNPDRSGEYTICNQTDLIVPDGMKKNANALKTRSSMDKTVSSMEMAIGSSMELTGSSMEQNGSSMDEIGSSVENYTHYTPFERHIDKHHSLTAPLTVSSGCSIAADAASSAIHHDISKEQNSATVPVKEDGYTSESNQTQLVVTHAYPTDLPSLDKCISESAHALEKDERKLVNKWLSNMSFSFVTGQMSFSGFRSAHASNDIEAILGMVAPETEGFVASHHTAGQWSEQMRRFSILKLLKIITGGFLLLHRKQEDVHQSFEDCWDSVWDTYQSIPDPADLPSAIGSEKTVMLLERICQYNKDGWPATGDTTIEFKMPKLEASRKAITYQSSNHASSRPRPTPRLPSCPICAPVAM